MREPGIPHRDQGPLRDGAALAGGQRGGDGALLARERGGDPRGDALAQPVDPGAQTRRIAGGRDRRSRDRETDRAEPAEPGAPREVEPARKHRDRRRLEDGADGEAVSGLEAGIGGSDGDADAPRRRLRRQPVDPGPV